MLYGNYCYIIIENFPQKFSLCSLRNENILLLHALPSRVWTRKAAQLFVSGVKNKQ